MSCIVIFLVCEIGLTTLAILVNRSREFSVDFLIIPMSISLSGGDGWGVFPSPNGGFREQKNPAPQFIRSFPSQVLEMLATGCPKSSIAWPDARPRMIP